MPIEFKISIKPLLGFIKENYGNRAAFLVVAVLVGAIVLNLIRTTEFLKDISGRSSWLSIISIIFISFIIIPFILFRIIPPDSKSRSVGRVGFVNFDNPPMFSVPLKHRIPLVKFTDYDRVEDLKEQLKLCNVLVLDLDRSIKSDRNLDDICIYWINRFKEWFPGIHLVGISNIFTFRMDEQPCYICKSLDELERHLRHHYRGLFER